MWITPKNARSYGYCEKCDYTSHNKYDFKRHLTTAKHKMDKKKRHQKTQDADVEGFVCACGKKYKYQSGLCKHKHKCKLNTLVSVGEDCKKTATKPPLHKPKHIVIAYTFLLSPFFLVLCALFLSVFPLLFVLKMPQIFQLNGSPPSWRGHHVASYEQK